MLDSPIKKVFIWPINLKQPVKSSFLHWCCKRLREQIKFLLVTFENMEYYIPFKKLFNADFFPENCFEIMLKN